MTVLQRFGSALNLNLHAHGLLLDGVYVPDGDGFACPRCGEPMVLRAVVIRPPATTRVLRGLKRALHGARAPPAAA